jgi:hypothetical protein
MIGATDPPPRLCVPGCADGMARHITEGLCAAPVTFFDKTYFEANEESSTSPGALGTIPG